MVSRFCLYSFVAKNRPTRMRQVPAPNGSSMIAFKPPCTNLAGMPITVSAPNQVAKVVVTTMISGRLRPAIAKSLVFLMRVPAQTPRPSVPSRYSTTKVIRVTFMRRRRDGRNDNRNYPRAVPAAAASTPADQHLHREQAQDEPD